MSWGEADYTWDFFDSRHPRARKEHDCGACRERIFPGDRYRAIAGKGDGDFFTTTLCARCALMYAAILDKADPGEAIDLELNCGHTWEDNFYEPPPDDVAALAFLDRAEAQEQLARLLESA